MTARANKPVSVTLGPLARAAEARVNAGGYASLSEVVRAGLRALESEDAALDAILKKRVEEALADPRPDLSADEVDAAMEALHRQRVARDA